MKTIFDFLATDINADALELYHDERGNTAFTGATAQDKESALFRGFDYIKTQLFRTDIDIFSNGIPIPILEAIYEAALEEIKKPGILNRTRYAEDEPHALTIGPLNMKYSTRKNVFQKIDALLSPFIKSSITLTR